MRILVDAMGGDNAPDQIALGAIQAAKDFGCEAVLVGRGEAILRALRGSRRFPRAWRSPTPTTSSICTTTRRRS